MKKTILLLAAILTFTAAHAEITVTVSNTLKIERVNETVEIQWSDITKRDANITKDNVVVTDAEGRQIASQVIYRDGAPLSLIFQATTGARKSAAYYITAGTREEYKRQAYGRFVPERKDDYAWENNLIAFRAYGPALESETITPGFDVWIKKTPELIIDKWYKDGDYHTDHGEGLDCYKVGPTLGAGGSSPVINGELSLMRNFESWELLDDGPIRTTVRLTYPVKIEKAGLNEYNISLVKTISLDANTHFNRITDLYKTNLNRKNMFTPSLMFAAGMTLHSDTAYYYVKEKEFIAMMEEASDSKTGNDGQIATAVIVHGGYDGEDRQNVFMAVNTSSTDNITTLKYLAGAGWSKYGVENLDKWIGIVSEESMKVKTPLKVKLK